MHRRLEEAFELSEVVVDAGLDCPPRQRGQQGCGAGQLDY
jgi:hypothetical protein